VRVASKAVYLVAPFDSEENNRAEELVLKYKKNWAIKEHKIYGLVDFDKIESVLHSLKENQTIKNFQKKELDNLLNWVTMMLSNHADESKIYQETHFLENRFVPRRIALSIYKV
jgi:hypothetical protein